MENSFTVTGYVCAQPKITRFDNVSVARFPISITNAYKDRNGSTRYTSAVMNVEAWRRNETACRCHEKLTKGKRLELSGSLRPDEWVSKDGKARNKVVLNARIIKEVV